MGSDRLEEARRLMSQTEHAGGYLKHEGGQLKFRRANPLPSELVERLKANKREVLDYLQYLDEIPPELAAWNGAFPTDVHRRAFPVSVTRPGDLARLSPDRLDWWQGIVAACMYYKGDRRGEAEGFAWAHIDKRHTEA